MLEEHVADGILTAKTRWLSYCEQVIVTLISVVGLNDDKFLPHSVHAITLQVKSSHTYLGVASNTTGSTPKDLFEDVMEDLEEQVSL
jgi:pre-mRNA-processing factor 40